MNDTQKKVLDLLNEDCRIPMEKMAVMLDMDLAELAVVIDGLEKDRVLLCYRPIINWDKTERQLVEAMIEVKVTPQREFGFDAVAKRINSFDEVRSVYLMSGSYDLLVQVAAPTLKELAQFVSERLSPLETVTGTSTSFVLKRYKQDGVIFDASDTDRRLMFSP
jgi:DNA-binding Lrp family transcriptional regulator